MIAEDCDARVHGAARLLIETETGSRYLLDPVAGTLTRELRGVLSNDLRRDGEPIKVLAVVRLRVGSRAVFALDLRLDGVTTFRPVTVVQRISAVQDPVS
ncbi:hypothetical protein [Arthrobacter sp. KK5.5]|uniref:hypothetical protein n=1 Tax=Arthrobacter sp. KK5.5 TaxID=3373084 RepID=UPI003EE51B51